MIDIDAVFQELSEVTAALYNSPEDLELLAPKLERGEHAWQFSVHMNPVRGTEALFGSPSRLVGEGPTPTEAVRALRTKLREYTLLVLPRRAACHARLQAFLAAEQP